MDAVSAKNALAPLILDAIDTAKDSLTSLDMDADKTMRARARISVLRNLLNKLDDAVAQGDSIDQFTFG